MKKLYCVVFNNLDLMKASSPRQLRNAIAVHRQLFNNIHIVRFWKEYEK